MLKADSKLSLHGLLCDSMVPKNLATDTGFMGFVVQLAVSPQNLLHRQKLTLYLHRLPSAYLP